ncbi:MAG: pyridine nucleotide-disulfide oxidoreductase [Dehalococcoidia bacterium]|nr:pyridine nucleotide-disulfide oxidoreductase [Dehalococcoidia bacterium]
MDQATVLILGGGVGGLVAANEVRRRLPDTHRVVLVEREASFVFTPSFLWLMTGLRKPDQISRPLARLERKGVEVLHGEIVRLDPERREIAVNGRVLGAEHLVISLGAELAPESVPGLAEAGHNLYTLAGATSLRDNIKTFRRGRLVVLVSAVPYKCPAAPYEAALLLEYDCRKRRCRDDVKLDLYAAEPGPMGVAGPELSAAVKELMASKGIAYHPEHQVTAIDPAAQRLSFAHGPEVRYDLLAYIPPHRAPAAVRDAGLCGDSGWVPVDRHTLETEHAGVYAIGDVTGIPLALGKPLPKAGVFAHNQAAVVARNIAHAVTGKGKPTQFDGQGECFIETGDGRAGFARGNFYGEPVPQVKMYRPGRHWHAGKVVFEKDWLRRWF